MARSADVVTRRVRDAANAAGLAVVAYAVLWFVTTQIHAIREVSPFADDPWDLVASFAALFLPLVCGATFIRSMAHRGPRLERAVARRIALGSGIAVAIVSAAVIADLAAVVTAAELAGTGGPVRAVIPWLVIVTAVVAGVATAFVARAVLALRRPTTVDVGTIPEPDVVDDALGLAAEVGIAGGLANAARTFLDASPVSPRRHRLAFGFLVAVAGAIAFVLWHAIREGPWASPAAALIFGMFPLVGILTIYLATLAPLRLLRRVPD
jgi:multisubunit Na+/H+ antiporter MnhC subunit